MSGDTVKHYGHDEGAWFWGCRACNPIESDKLGGELHIPAEIAGPRVDWYCTVCEAGMTTWHGTALASCGHCGQTESPLVKVVVDKSDLYQDVVAMVKRLSEAEQIKLLDELPSVCPWDCDSCHDEDCPCERMGCAGEKE